MNEGPEVNPYASPRSPSDSSGGTGRGRPIGAALPWEPTDAVSFGWQVVKRQPMAVVVFFVALLLANLISIGGAVVNAVLQQQHDRELRTIGLVVYGVCALVNLPISVYINIGLVAYAVKLARGQAASLADAFAGGPFLSFFGGMLLVGLGVGAGTLLCIVPGVILALGWYMFSYLIVDRRLGAIESLSTSWRVTKGHKVKLFVFMLLGMLVNLAGMLACGIGLLVTVPITLIALPYIYLKLTGEEPVLPAA
jgi:hypothetical protein